GTTSAQTIPAYNTLPAITPGEGLSVTENVDFDAVASGIIRPDVTTATLIESGGTVISGYATDFENNARGPYPLGGQANGGGLAPDLGADEGDFIYIVPPVPDCPMLILPANGAIDICPSSVVTLTWSASMTGGPASGGYDIFFGTNPTPPFVVNTASLSYVPTGLVGNTTYYWKIVPKNGSGSAVGCVTNSFTTTNVIISGTTPGMRCGTGTVNLSATGSGTLNWYANASGGAVLQTGPAFTTPVINTTTNFYVGASAGLTSENVASPTIGTSTFYTASVGWGLRFTVNSSCSITSVKIKASNTIAGAASMQIKITDLSDVVLYTGTVHNFTIGTTLAEYVIPVNVSVPPGNYKMVMTATGIDALVRESVGVSFPYNAPSGAVSITAGATGTGTAQTTSAYYWFYNWILATGCETPRTAVTATVTPSDPILISPSSITRCQLEPATSLTASSTYAYTNYTWTPATGLNMATGATVMASPSTTTTYTVTGDDGTCANTASVVVTVLPAPTSPLAAATPNPACEGTVVNLSSSAAILPYSINSNCNTTFVDISASGTSVPDALGDDTEHNITIPAFTFNGIVYTFARVGMNGAIALNSTTGEIGFTNAALPSTANSAGNILLLPYWDDLNIQTSPTIKTQTIGSVFMIQYTNLAHNNFTTGSITFQVQLNLTTGVITYVYQDVIFGDP
ncbi:MAG: hypothetical protein M3R25_11495, partial [Bacteroidota bacterium]|nr:hypothetical protein [Bacteroidota bacterium]